MINIIYAYLFQDVLASLNKPVEPDKSLRRTDIILFIPRAFGDF